MKTAKLSKPMERALALAEEKGSLVRRPGGYWTPPGEPMEGLALNMRPIRGMDRYVPSHTVNALRDRGLLTGSKWNEPAEFPGSRADNQRRAFHEGTMYAAAEAYDAWLSNPTPETYARAAELGLAEFYAKLDAYGEECERCDGRGEVPGKTIPKSWSSPAETPLIVCSNCRGRGKVLPFGMR